MKKINEDLLKIIISSILFIISFFLSPNSTFYLIVLGLSYIIIAYEMFLNSIQNIFRGDFFDENTLMIIATIGAFFIHEYPEAVMVILLFQLGEYFSDLAVNRSKKAVTDLMDLRLDTIRLLQEGKEIIKHVELAKIDDLFIVKPGERIPLDGVIVDGTSYLDTSSLTGESIPRRGNIGDTVLSGFICNDQILTIRATTSFETSTANRIISLIENSNDKKSNTEKFITKFSKIYTPTIVAIATLIAIIPTFFGIKIHDSLYTSLVFLVMSCPCALVLSVPLAFFCGIGRASREGILVKGANELEKAQNINTILFDKTGTITKGVFEIVKIQALNGTDEDLLEIAAYGEFHSNHPIAKSIQNSYAKKIDSKRIQSFHEIRGKGIEVQIDRIVYFLGNANFLKEKKISFEEKNDDVGTIVYISTENQMLGYIVISDELRPNIDSSIQSLKQIGIQDIVVLSGDHKRIVKAISEKVGIENYYAALLPEDKVKIVEKYKKHGTVCFVGDGINDAPVLQMSDIGIAMGGIGSDAAIEASDVVLMHDDISKIEDFIRISRMTKKWIILNIGFALFIKFLVLTLGLMGYTTVWLAVFADVGVTILCVLNTLQILKRKLK